MKQLFFYLYIIYTVTRGMSSIVIWQKEEKNNRKEKIMGKNGQNGKNILFKEALREWQNSKKGLVKESTYVNYSNLIESHLVPDIGAYALSSVSTELLNDYLKKKLCSGRLDGKGGLSPKTVYELRSVLIYTIKYAKQSGYSCKIADDRLFCPKGRKPQIRVFTRQEQERLEAYLFQETSPLHISILVTLYSGLRIGELCALKWGDIHLSNGVISIKRIISRIRDLSPDAPTKTKIIIDLPKTECSSRDIPLPDFIVEFLGRFRQEKEVYLLTGTKKYMEPRSCLNNYKQVLLKAGLEDFNFHTLRHTFATRCVESGFDVKSLSEILGHANVNTTMQRYVHPSMDLKRKEMNKLEQICVCGQNFL